jgi:hypothetical protein
VGLLRWTAAETIRTFGQANAFCDGKRRNQPAVFLKLLVLLVPREMKMEHSGGVKAMTDEQLERGIELIKEMSGAGS